MSSGITAVAALGKNWEVPIPENPADIRLSIDSQMTAWAAGILLDRGVADLVIFSGGHTAGYEYPSEADAMNTDMRTHRQALGEPEIPADVVLLEEESFNTRDNFQRIKPLMVEHNIIRLIPLTVFYHEPRTRLLTRRQGLPVTETYKSDHVVQEHYGEKKHYYAQEIVRQTVDRRSVRPLVRVATAFAMEAGAWVAVAIDPSGDGFPTKITKLLRHQNG